MKPEKGQHVKCFMRSTMVLEGIVEDWNDSQVVLKSLGGESLMIVHKPAEDIVLTKVVLEEPVEIPKEKEAHEPSAYQQQVRQKLQESLDAKDDPDLSKMNLNQLRNMVVEQDKLISTQKRREHFGSPFAPKRVVQYSNYLPGRLPNTPGGQLAPDQTSRSAYAPRKPIKR